jgi:hypothetical protein
MSNNVSILQGNGNGSFAPAVTYPGGGSSPVSLTTGDFNGDGKTDLAVSNAASFTVGVLLNMGNGTFTPPVVYMPPVLHNGLALASIVSADLNGDAKPDLVVTNSSDNIIVLLNNGNGTFASGVAFPSSSTASGPRILVSPVFIVTGDFNSDGRTDLAVANDVHISTSHVTDIGILLNTCGSVTPSLTIQPMSSTKGFIGAARQERATTFVLSVLPNPFAHSTRIQYSLPVDAHVNIKVYDVLGREVNTLFSGIRNAGTYLQEFNSQKLSQGVYYCRMVATASGKEYLQTQKLVKTE